MKNKLIKLGKLFTVVAVGSLAVTGCFKSDTMEDINIVTTKYPIEYALNELYGDRSNITSIYPNGVDVTTYTLTKKKIKEYSNMDMFVYNHLSNEGDLAIEFSNNNEDLKLINVADGLSIDYDEEELWLSPSKYLKVVQNLKNELESYINSTVILQEIDEKYEKLNLIISTYDAQLNTVAKNASNKTIIVTNDTFKFLEKYGFTVLSIEESENYTSASYNKAMSGVKDGSLSYIFELDGDEETDKEQALINAGAQKVTITKLSNLTDEEKEELVDYQKVMEDFIEKLKQEVY